MLALFLASAAAAAAPVDSPQVLLDALYERLEAGPVPDAHEPGERWTCLTDLVAQVLDEWDRFTPEQQRELERVLGPRPTPRAAPAPEGAASTCFGEQYPNRVTSEHFAVEWEDGALTEEEAQAFIDALEYSWDVEVGELGWQEPEGTGTYLLAVYVPKYDQYAGAYTSVANCGGGTLPYIVAYSGSFQYDEWFKTMACHEFNHALQFGYGEAHEFWWWEATATYIEEPVYPDANDWADMVWVYGQYPYIGMNASAGNSNNTILFYHTYGMAIWGFYLDNHLGGPDLVRDTWEYSQDHGGYYSLWMPDVIEGLGYDWDEVYEEFMAAAAVGAFDESDLMPTPAREDTLRQLPASGEVVDSSTLPQSLGQNFIRFRADAVPEGKVLRVHFDGEDGVAWHAVLVRGDGAIDEITRFELDENGEGWADISMDGETDAWLVVSPEDPTAKGWGYSWTRADAWSYTWEAMAVDPGAPIDTGGVGDTGGEPGTSPLAGEDAASAGCGCSGAGRLAPGALWIAGLGLVALRRRRGE